MTRPTFSRPAFSLPSLNLWGLALLALCALAWQWGAQLYHTPFFPSPLDVLRASIEQAPEILSEIGATLRRAAMSLAIALVTMIPFGILCGRIRWVGLVIDPLLEFLTTLPPPAVIPLAMLFAGTGDGAKIAVILYSCAPSVLINTLEGVRQSPAMLDRVARSLRLSSLETMVLVDLPAALPPILTGVRLAVGSSLLVAITSEMLLSTDGIGTFVQRSQETFRMDGVLAGILCISLTGLAVNAGLRGLERRLLFWHHRQPAT